MVYLKQVESLSDEALALTREDIEKRAFLMVTIDDPKEKAKDNAFVVTAGTQENVQALLEVLLDVDELVPLVAKAMLNIIAREQERNFNINDLLNELKNEN